MSFISSWIAHPMETNGRSDLNNTDKLWEKIYPTSLNDDDTHVEKNTLLFRVHSTAGKKPKLSDYSDMINSEEVFKYEMDLWEKRRDINAIKWDNHWVSFTPDPDVIGSHYFGDKGLRGLVIVIKSDKAINITNFKRLAFDESEVVAPMDQSTCIEVLSFNDFINKYGTGKSDYEKHLNKL